MKNQCVGVIVMMAATAPALAHGDIWLYSQDGQLRTGEIEEFPLEGRTENVRVFHAELGEDVDNAIDEPGLRALVGGLDPAGELSFTVNRALRAWDGSSFDALGTYTMTIGFETLSATTSTVDAAVPGFGIGVNPDGSTHDHYEFLLNAPTRVQGIWLLDVTFHYSGLASSDPVWILFSQDLDEVDVEPAEEWARANVPAPGALATIGAAGLFMTRRRRRAN